MPKMFDVISKRGQRQAIGRHGMIGKIAIDDLSKPLPWFRDRPVCSSLLAGLAGVAPSTLSARLKTLEKQGVIGTRLYEKHPPPFEYFLTDKGQTLGPVLKALHKWGERYG